MQLWKPEFELDRVDSGSLCHCLPVGMLVDGEREIVQQLCVRWYVAWRWDLADDRVGVSGCMFLLVLAHLGCLVVCVCVCVFE